MSLRQRLFPSKPSLVARVVRGALRLTSPPYAMVMYLRNLAYDWSLFKTRSVDVPVLCVGNLSVGGTGKTPMVAWLCSWLRSKEVRVAIVSRGYGQLDSGSNDEALELELALPDVPHLQNSDRSAAAQLAREELEMQAIVLDDGFQHRRLRRDLDIVLIDASEPAAADWCLPGGLMRESWNSLKRAGIVVLSRSHQASAARLKQLRQRIARRAPLALVVSSQTEPLGWHGINLPFVELNELRGRQVLAFCGIGNPTAFFQSLEQLGLTILDRRAFPDHHAFSAEDVQQLSQWASSHPTAAAVVCTMKDWVKLQTPRLGPVPLAALKIGISFGSDQAKLEQRLEEVLAKSLSHQ